MSKSSIARRVYCFDIDGTLCSNTEGDYKKAKPFFRRISRLNKLYRVGHTIILFTARGFTTKINWESITRSQLSRWGVKYHRLVFGKPTADVYIDDKCQHVEEWMAPKLNSKLKKKNRNEK